MTRRAALFGALGIFGGAAAILFAMGRPPICACGYIALWHGAVDAGNSQHLADWYSASHVVHGLLFFAGGAWALRRWSARGRYLIALTIEAAWEVIENSPAVIERYRQATIALGYTGDSIVNSLADIGFMSLGFVAAALLPWRGALALGVALELVALAAIRDNLTLNVLMLVWPIAAIRRWQAG